MKEEIVLGLSFYLLVCGLILNVLIVAGLFLDNEIVSVDSLNEVCHSLNGLEWEFDEEREGLIVCKKTDVRLRGGGR